LLATFPEQLASYASLAEVIMARIVLAVSIGAAIYVAVLLSSKLDASRYVVTIGVVLLTLAFLIDAMPFSDSVKTITCVALVIPFTVAMTAHLVDRVRKSGSSQ